MEHRSWMYSSNKGDVVSYFEQVTKFTEAAAQYASRQSEAAIYCPCKVCKNEAMYPCSDHETIRFHLLKNGFVKNYYIWTKQGDIGLDDEWPPIGQNSDKTSRYQKGHNSIAMWHPKPTQGPRLKPNGQSGWSGRA